MGVQGWPGAGNGAGYGKGTTRSAYLYGSVPGGSAGTSGNWWRTRMGIGVGSATGGPTTVANGAGLAAGYAFGPVIPGGFEGARRSLRGVENTAPTYQTIDASTLNFHSARMDQPLGTGASDADALWIFRECICYEDEAAVNPAHRSLHGLSLVPNLIAGFPLLTTGSWRGIALVRTATGYLLAVKNANPATTFTIPAPIDLLSGPAIVEHRLYRPTAVAIGRYELWYNGARALAVPGDHPNFPRPLSQAEAFVPMPFAMDAPGGATIVRQYCYWGEIITGPDLPGTY